MRLERAKTLARQGLALLGALLGFVALPVAAGVLVQNIHILGELPYAWPASQGAASTALTDASGDGTLTWEEAEPPDIVAFTVNGTCPPGWTVYTPAQGRYIVGRPASGTNAAQVGTALTDLEARPTGQHSHAVTDPGHTHTQNAHTHSVTDPGHAHGHLVGGSQYNARVDTETSARLGSPGDTGISGTGIGIAGNAGGNSSNLTGITALASSGGTTGTNVPYVQLVICRSGG